MGAGALFFTLAWLDMVIDVDGGLRENYGFLYLMKINKQTLANNRLQTNEPHSLDIEEDRGGRCRYNRYGRD